MKRKLHGVVNTTDYTTAIVISMWYAFVVYLFSFPLLLCKIEYWYCCFPYLTAFVCIIVFLMFQHIYLQAYAEMEAFTLFCIPMVWQVFG